MGSNSGININDKAVKKLTDDLDKAADLFKNVSQKNHDSKTTLTAVKKSKTSFSNISQKAKEINSTTKNEAKRLDEIKEKYKKMDQEQGKKNSSK